MDKVRPQNLQVSVQDHLESCVLANT